MQFGIIGLGNIGGGLALQAIDKGIGVVGYDRDAKAVERLAAHGLTAASSIGDLVAVLAPPRCVMAYVPHGAATDQVFDELGKRLSTDDVAMDGGNSHWKHSRARYEKLRALGTPFLDVGTSGGVAGARHGACFMVGGEQAAFEQAQGLLEALAVPGGVVHAGPPGAGHFVKLIHNAIEFGMMQAIGEGVDLLKRSDYDLDLPALFENWSHGSVIRGWLVELMTAALRENRLDDIDGYVEDTREVRWAIEYALEKEAWIPVISQAELALYRSRDRDNVSGKAVSLMRHGFGEHPVFRK